MTKSYLVSLEEMPYEELVSALRHVGQKSAWDKNQLLQKFGRYSWPRPPRLHWRDEDVEAMAEGVRRAWECLRLDRS